MGMKFLNKKGWHTGSLRNIETVWKAEQKQEAEQKKLEELRLQILQERERSEFRALQEQAGLIPRQERLEFLYDSGLAVGKGNASGSGVSFQKEEQPLAKAEAGNSASEKPDQSAPGALFEEKAQSANDSWRKLHSDPLLLIRQREQEALAKIKNNPVKMALIRKSVEEKGKGKDGDTKEHKKKHKRKSGKHHKQPSSRQRSDSEEDSGEEYNGRKSHHQKTSGTHGKHYERPRSDLEDESKGRESRDRHYERRRSELDDEYKRRESHDTHYERRRSELDDESKRRESRDKHYERQRSDLDDESKRRESLDKHYERRRSDLDDESKRRESQDKRRRSDIDEEPKRRDSHREIRLNEKYRNHSPKGGVERENLKSYGQEDKKRKTEDLDNGKHPSRENEYQNRRRKGGSKLSEEERAARLKQMQMDAEVHEEQRWRRLKKADETEAVEADKNKVTTGKSFLDDANKSVYGIEKGGSSTIEESVRRRSYYSQRGTAAEGNAFRR
ncbi:CBF1-interacting co-repressor CIR N-terminal domain [Arabidopsis suecica]|uniref:CBF1-interacting co-repressor CIR N-terminal domain n=1 Tax=Arabidopsis suecica TaxID=45249 RepID=A0A8T2API4_ARASU|nr:CBF1-interacting co-repressor CIR N-terminal domain [Arabidopsis suecica]